MIVQWGNRLTHRWQALVLWDNDQREWMRVTVVFCLPEIGRVTRYLKDRSGLADDNQGQSAANLAESSHAAGVRLELRVVSQTAG